MIGCTQEDPNPELRDPIFHYLNDKVTKAKQEVETQSKQLIETEKDFRKSDPNSIDRKDALRKLEKARRLKARAEQVLEFYKIRAERRRVEGRRAYKIAFSQGKDWPDPKEFEQFTTSQRLRESSRKWSDRVPKLQDRITAAWPDEEKRKLDNQRDE